MSVSPDAFTAGRYQDTPCPAPGTRFRTLVAGTDAAGRDLITGAMRAWNANGDVHVAKDADDATRLMHAIRFDCIFIDCSLGEAGAGALLALLRGANWPPTATILLTETDDTSGGGAADAHPDILDRRALTRPGIQRALQSALGRSSLSRRIEEQRAILGRLSREIEQVSYLLSQDVHLPLQRMVNDLQQLTQRDALLHADDRDAAMRLGADSVLLQQRVASLVQMSHLGHDCGDVQRVDFEDVLRDARAQHAAAIDATGAIITWDRMPDIACNRRLIVQLMCLLIGSAVSCHRQVAPRLHVSVVPEPIDSVDRLSFATALRRQTVWRFTLADNGPGFCRHAESRYDVLQFLRAASGCEGSGPGLVLCDKIVNLHGGQFWIEAADGNGTQFRFTLPSVQP